MKTILTIAENDDGGLVLILPRPAVGVPKKPCGCRKAFDLIGEEEEAGTGMGVPNCPNDGAVYTMKCQNGTMTWAAD